uniref:Uncharacterized protein n=1 Tax=Glossina pallidipes TaxID=7398 RepID=A0A1A9ZUI1_GLOPL
MSKPRLSNFTKMLMQVESTSLDDYSAPDSIQFDNNVPHPKTKPTRIKYDFFDMTTGPIRNDGGPLIDQPSYTGRKTYSKRLRKARHDYSEQFRHEITGLACCERRSSDHIAFVCVMTYSALWPLHLASGQTCSTTQCPFPRTSKYLDRLRRLLSTKFT